MTTISNLPQELVEEILSRAPLTSLRRVRSTCKKWNVLSKDKTFTKKHLAQAAAREDEFLAIMEVNYSLYLMSINLQRGVNNNDFDPSIRLRGKLISHNNDFDPSITRVCHCEGLLLCTTNNYTKLVLWDPYSGQTRWICDEPKSVDLSYFHALGYKEGKSCRIYKILRFHRPSLWGSVNEMYDANSNTWRRVLDVNSDWTINLPYRGVSVMGNTYWFARDDKQQYFLIGFDFTAENFGPRLPLPFEIYYKHTVILSSIRDEQLAALVQNRETDEMEVWVTTKIEPNALSWSKFLAVDMAPLTAGFVFSITGSFLVIDKEKRAVVVFDKAKKLSKNRGNTAYFIGGNGYFREVDLRDIESSYFFPKTFSYVPSSVQINHLA